MIREAGWLKRKALAWMSWELWDWATQGHNNAKMGDIPNTWFPHAPYHYGTLNHTGGIKWTGYFSTNLWEPKGLPLREIGECKIVQAHSRCPPLEGGNNLQSLSNPHDAYFGITYNCRPTQRWTNTLIHACGNIQILYSFREALCLLYVTYLDTNL